MPTINTLFQLCTESLTKYSKIMKNKWQKKRMKKYFQKLYDCLHSKPKRICRQILEITFLSRWLPVKTINEIKLHFYTAAKNIRKYNFKNIFTLIKI